jgi:hypothetical protein
LKRRIRNKLAVSTVVANMMMISITLGLAAILVTWAGTTYGTFSSGSGIYFAQRGQALQERFVVENVFFNATTSTVMIFVRNVGTEEVNLVGLYINGATYSPRTGSGLCTFGAPSQPLGVGRVCEFSISWLDHSSQTWPDGAILNIVVTSARGNRATFTARGP